MDSRGAEERKLLRACREDLPRRLSLARIVVPVSVFAWPVWTGAPAQAATLPIFGSSLGVTSSTIADPYPLAGPSGVAIDESPAGAHDVYITDPGHSRVEKFDSSGKFLLM